MSTTSKSNQMLKLAVKSWGSTNESSASRKASIRTAAQKQTKSASLTKQASQIVVLRDVFLEVFGERNFLVHLIGVEVPILVTIYEFMETLQQLVCIDDSGLWNFIPLNQVLYFTEYVG